MLHDIRRFAVIALGVFAGLSVWSLVFRDASEPEERWAQIPMAVETGLDDRLYAISMTLDAINETLDDIEISTGVSQDLTRRQCGDITTPCYVEVLDDLSVYVTNKSLVVTSY